MELMEVSQKLISLNINLESSGRGETKVENGLHGGDCCLICLSAGMRLLSKGLLGWDIYIYSLKTERRELGYFI